MESETDAPFQVGGAGIAIIDEAGRLIESNQRFGSLINASPDGQDPGDWIASAGSPPVGRAMEVLRNSVCPECVSMDLKSDSKEDTGLLKATLSRLPGSNRDEGLRFLLMLEDQPRQRPGDSLAQADVQRAILSRFDHDLRSRLNVISGYCAMATEDLVEKDGAEETIEDLRCVATAANELLSLNHKTSDLLGLVQGNWENAIEEILPANILADVIKDIRPKFALHTFALEADDSTIRTDANMLSKLVTAVISILCRELSGGCKLGIIAGERASEKDYEIVVNCTPSARMPADKIALENLMNQLRQRTRGDARVPNLDLFYTDTLCDALGAQTEAGYDPDSGKLGYSINLPLSTSGE